MEWTEGDSGLRRGRARSQRPEGRAAVPDFTLKVNRTLGRAVSRETKHQICASLVTPLARFSVLKLNVPAVHQGTGAGEVTVPGARRGPEAMTGSQLPPVLSVRRPHFGGVCMIGHFNGKFHLLKRMRCMTSTLPGGCWKEARGSRKAVTPREWLLKGRSVHVMNEAGSGGLGLGIETLS